jgi:hypothetical protein
VWKIDTRSEKTGEMATTKRMRENYGYILECLQRCVALERLGKGLGSVVTDLIPVEAGRREVREKMRMRYRRSGNEGTETHWSVVRVALLLSDSAMARAPSLPMLLTLRL